MKSKAHFKGHPLHPMLVSFPIAFFTGTLLFDILGLACERNDYHTIAMYLGIAGIGFAVLAAVPGIIDYIFVVPPKSSAKKRGAKHGITNTVMVLVFAMALILRRQGTTSIYIIMGLELIGLILLSIAGWMGGTLVFRNQIGVDIRYADAGKWKESYIKDTTKQVLVAEAGELKVNQMKLLHINDQRIVLCRTEKGYAAFDDRCTHRGASLAAGAMICGTVQCPWHGSQFDVNTGELKAGPAKVGIKVYDVVESGKKVWLTIGKE